MIDVTRLYESWLAYPNLPEDLEKELREIEGDEAAITDRFYRDLEFGTGGLRGILGAGINRMNLYTVRRATLGLATYLLAGSTEAARRGVVIGYDCRRKSTEFAREVGLVLAAAGVRAYVYEHLCPTPELSFAVRHLRAAAGVMITASHNPPEYNGYKVYDTHGCQVLPDEAAQITEYIANIQDLFQIPVADESEASNRSLFTWVGAEIDELYYDRVVNDVVVPDVTEDDRRTLTVVYTPLHGTGNIPVRTTLQRAGYRDVRVVPSQALPDGEFSTVKSPNPEETEAFTIALRLAKESEADVVLGTDPDADRVGVAARNVDGSYTLLTGNQTGGLLIDFLLRVRSSAGRLPADAFVCKTIVTSELGAEVARRYGVTVIDTLTGFKFIGEQIQRHEELGDMTFLFGYEESYGYLISPFVRDKDAVQSCLLIAEMAAWYKRQGLTLMEALEQLFERVGYFQEALISVTMPGEDGLQRIRQVMSRLRTEGLRIEDMTIAVVEDYELRQACRHTAEGTEVTPITLPQADVLKYLFADGSWLAIRPSGTEPKIKVYIGAKSPEEQDCQRIIERLRGLVRTMLAE